MGERPPDLWDFQVEDIAKIETKKCGLIGSEMGTGKTREAVELDKIWWEYSKKPTLLVCPRNTFTGWIDTYRSVSPESELVVIDRKRRDIFEDAIAKGRGDVFITHWEAIRLMPQLGKTQFGLVIADEVHRASNRKAQQTRALKKIRTDRKLGLSGTASGDNVLGLWSVINWMWPAYYTSYWNFAKAYSLTSWNSEKGYMEMLGPNPNTLPRLIEEMTPWYVRHLKREECCHHHPLGVMPWLPDKIYSQVWVDLSPAQRRVYNEMKKNMVAWVGEHEDSPLVASIVIAQLTRLSQMCLATPELGTKVVNHRDGTSETVQTVELIEPSTKLDALMEILEDNPNKKFVVFTSSKKMAYLACKRMAKANIGSIMLSGDTPDADRDTMVARFRDGREQCFVGVIAAISEGIDGLQWATDTGIFLDRDWSTLKNKQAEDRLHRGGQKDTVQIIDIIARNTVDLGRHARLVEKWAWIKAILGDKVDQKTGEVAA